MADKEPWIITIIFYYLAIGTLLPWNFFINVNGYWMYKFRTVSNGTTDNITLSSELNPLQLEFMSDLAKYFWFCSITHLMTIICPYFSAAMIPNVTFLILNGIIGHRFNMARRLYFTFKILNLTFINS